MFVANKIIKIIDQLIFHQQLYILISDSAKQISPSNYYHLIQIDLIRFFNQIIKATDSIDNHKQRTEMQTRTNKVFLPQNYQDYLAQKKKFNRLIINKSSMTGTENQSHQNNLNKLASLKSPNASTKKNTTQIEEANSHRGQDDSKEIRIVQKTVFSQYSNLMGDFENNKFQSIKNKMQLEFERLKEDTPLPLIEVNQILKKIEVQSLQNIRKLQIQMKAPFHKRNSESLDQMLSFNKFFVILNKEKRFKIYQNCELIKVQAGQIVYEENQPNQYMYVVVKGCVKQYENKSTSYQDKVQVNFVSYYQGSNFGQAPLVGESIKGKRYNTTQATQQTYLLRLSNNFYKELITNSAQDDFQKKITALLETSIFRDTSKMFVTPLLPTLSKQILPYGTVLIRQGDEVRKLYFIAEGNLEVMLLDRARRNIRHLNIQQKPKSFSIKKTQSKNTKNKQQSFSIHNTFYYPQNNEKNRKEFLYGNKKIINQELQYNEQIIFNTLRIGDFLGGKSFLQQSERQKKMLNSQHFDTSIRARLSVLSGSPQTIVYSIDQKKFFSLSDNFQKMIVEGIMESKYFDQENIQLKADNEREWKKYSQKLIEDVILSKKNRSKSFRI